MIQVDTTDKAILRELLSNARQPISLIAKRAKTTRDIVTYRIAKLEQAGIVTSYIPKIRQSIFASGVALLVLKFVRLNSAREKEIITFVKNHPKTNWVARICGKADMLLTIQYIHSKDLAETVSEIIDAIGQQLGEYQLHMYICEYKYETAQLLGAKQQPTTVEFTDEKKESVDQIDTIILQQLYSNARASNTQIAHHIKSSEDMVRQRIKRLEKKNVIFGYTALIDLQKLGYETYHLLISLEPFNTQIEQKLKYFVQEHPAIIHSSRLAGKSNCTISFCVKNHVELDAFIREIKDTFAMQLVEFDLGIIMETYKTVYVPKELLQQKK